MSTNHGFENSNRPPRRHSFWMAAVLLAGGCAAPSPNVTATPSAVAPSSEAPAPGITVYEDPAFTKSLGEVAAFSVVCADYKDLHSQSLQPSQVVRYKVLEETPAQHIPPLAGYVDPAQHPLVVGTAPAC